MPKTRTEPKILYRNRKNSFTSYFFHQALAIPLPLFFLGAFSVFFTVNLAFSFLYLMFHGLFNSVDPSAAVSFPDALYFSLTFPVVGFGGLAPVGMGRVISALQVFLGLLFLSALTGLIFSRFSKGKSPLVWSSPLVLRRKNGKIFLEARVTNILGNDVVNVNASLFLQKIEKNMRGEATRPIVPLPLTISMIPITAFSWILTHPVDESSPARRWAEGNSEENERMVGFIYGYDSTLGKDIYSYARWQPKDMLKGHFDTVITDYQEDEDLRVSVMMDISKLDHVVPEEDEEKWQ